jgi:hypothetical protein
MVSPTPDVDWQPPICQTKFTRDPSPSPVSEDQIRMGKKIPPFGGTSYFYGSKNAPSSIISNSLPDVSIVVSFMAGN